MLLRQRGTLPTRGVREKSSPGTSSRDSGNSMSSSSCSHAKFGFLPGFWAAYPTGNLQRGCKDRLMAAIAIGFTQTRASAWVAACPACELASRLPSAAVGRCVWEGVKGSWIKTRPRKPSSLPLAAWDKRCGCLRCASVSVHRQRRLCLWN